MFVCLFIKCAQSSGTEKTVTGRATVKNRMKYVTREQDGVQLGVLTVGQEMLVIKVRRNIEATVYSFIHSFIHHTDRNILNTERYEFWTGILLI